MLTPPSMTHTYASQVVFTGLPTFANCTLRLLSSGAFALAAPLLCPVSCPPPWHCSSLARSALGAALRFAPIHIDTACLGAAPLWRCPSLAAAVIFRFRLFSAHVALSLLLLFCLHSRTHTCCVRSDYETLLISERVCVCICMFCRHMLDSDSTSKESRWALPTGGL